MLVMLTDSTVRFESSLSSSKRLSFSLRAISSKSWNWLRTCELSGEEASRSQLEERKPSCYENLRSSSRVLSHNLQWRQEFCDLSLVFTFELFEDFIQKPFHAIDLCLIMIMMTLMEKVVSNVRVIGTYSTLKATYIASLIDIDGTYEIVHFEGV